MKLAHGNRPNLQPAPTVLPLDHCAHTRKEVPHATQPRRPAVFFEPMSKRRRGYPSETNVKRDVQIVHGDKLLEEKLGRNDLCPYGSVARR